MYLTLYMATQRELPVHSSPELSVEEVEPSREAVRQWCSLPVVRFIGAHTGCSCGFPHVVAEEPIEYWDGCSRARIGRPIWGVLTRSLASFENT